jgi:large subunit ribosomal protein L10
LNREEKAAAIAEIAGDIKESQAIIAVDPTGLSVSQAAEIRTKLRDADARLRVVKNTLTLRAADEAGVEALKELLTGPTALTFVRGDAAAAAKAISDYARTTDLLPFKGGYMDGEPLDVEQIKAIAKLPSRDVLYGQLVGMIASPITGLARGLNALLSGVAIALGQVHAKAEAGEIQLGGGAGEAPAPAAEEPAAEEPAADEPAAEEPTAEAEEAPAEEAPAETATEEPADQDAEAPDAGQTPSTEEPAEGSDDTPEPETTEE